MTPSLEFPVGAVANIDKSRINVLGTAALEVETRSTTVSIHVCRNVGGIMWHGSAVGLESPKPSARICKKLHVVLENSLKHVQRRAG